MPTQRRPSGSAIGVFFGNAASSWAHAISLSLSSIPPSYSGAIKKSSRKDEEKNAAFSQTLKNH
jgi:hypothetical protein